MDFDNHTKISDELLPYERPGFFSRPEVEALLLSSWALTQSGCVPMLLGLVHYHCHGALAHQTVINQLLAYMHSVLLAYSATGFNLYLAKALADGPLPAVLCKAQYIMVESVIVALMLTLCQLNVLKYLFAAVWKNVGAISDDLVARYFAVLNSALAAVYAGASAILAQPSRLYLAFCQESPNTSEVSHLKTLDLLYFLVTVSVLLSVFVQAATYLKRRTEEDAQQHNSVVLDLFDFGDAVNVFGMLTGFASLAPALITRYLYRDRVESAALVVSSFLAPQMYVLLVVPGIQYAMSHRLRSHVGKYLQDTWAAAWLSRIAGWWAHSFGSSVQPLDDAGVAAGLEMAEYHM